MASSALPSVDLDSDLLPRGPWLFGRNVRPPREAIEAGAIVEVRDASARFVGHALYNPASDIRLRWLSRGKKSALERPAEFVLARIAAADRLRRKGLRLQEHSDAYRIVHAEGDDLSGLIVDRLGPCLVVEYHALGFWKLRAEIEAALRQLYPGFPIHARVPDNAARAEDFPDDARTEIDPAAAEFEIREHGLRFPVAAAGGHKTGWFCDQRDNRQRIAALARGRDCLDLCCNAGGFALNCARAGARSVRALDLDEKVLARAARAAQLNQLAVETIHADLFDYLRRAASDERRPDLLVLDPHKLVASQRELENGLRHYSDMNTLALAHVRPGGLVATFSCSGSVDLPTFLGMLFGAARRAERELKLLSILEAGPDHPQRPDFPRSRYLKGALLAVD